MVSLELNWYPVESSCNLQTSPYPFQFYYCLALPMVCKCMYINNPIKEMVAHIYRHVHNTDLFCMVSSGPNWHPVEIVCTFLPVI